MTEEYFGDSGYTKAGEVAGNLSLPYAYIHNATDEKGQGGLWIPREQMPDDAIIDENFFKEVRIGFRDKNSPTGQREEPGYLASKYHLIVLGFDHDEAGRPRAWKNPIDNKWVFYVYAIVWQAFSEKTPFRIKYGGVSNSIRMSQHIRFFDRYVVGEATAIKRKAKADSLPASRNQFLLPVSHEAEMVGRDEQSWACPVQEFNRDTVKVDSNGRRTGTSTLKKFADDWELLKGLYIPKLQDVDGEARVTLAAEWTDLYGAQAKLIGEGGPAASGKDFSTDENELADKTDMEVISSVSTSLNVDPDKEIQILRGSNGLVGGADDSTIFDLTKAGAQKLINHLKAKQEASTNAASIAPRAQQKDSTGGLPI